VLQHPHEAKRKLATVPVVQKCLEMCAVVRDRRLLVGACRGSIVTWVSRQTATAGCHHAGGSAPTACHAAVRHCSSCCMATTCLRAQTELY
jgi:hypothetical protein